VDIFSSYASNSHKVKVYDIHEVVSVKSVEHAVCVASIYLNDAKTNAKKQDLINHLNCFNKVGDEYKFNFIQRFVILQRL
jgi:hypothetical protein